MSEPGPARFWTDAERLISIEPALSDEDFTVQTEGLAPIDKDLGLKLTEVTNHVEQLSATTFALGAQLEVATAELGFQYANPVPPLPADLPAGLEETELAIADAIAASPEIPTPAYAVPPSYTVPPSVRPYTPRRLPL